MNAFSHQTRRPSWSGIGLLLLLAGCGKSGPELAPVSGRVVLDGQPLAGAEIVFQPDERKPPSYGFTDEGGRYELGYTRDKRGALVGWHTVRIKAGEVAAADRETVRRRASVPPRYNENSELRRQVQPDENNVVDFELASEPQEAGSGEQGARSRNRPSHSLLLAPRSLLLAVPTHHFFSSEDDNHEMFLG